MKPSRLALVSAFAAVYVLWGTTYLAIRIALESLPPFLLAAARFLTAGSLIFLFSRLRGTPRPAAVHWRSAFIAGGMLLLLGNGLVVWAEQFVASGLAAMLVAVAPLWFVVLEWWAPGGRRPDPVMLAGVLLGFGGLVVLVGPGEIAGAPLHLPGALALVVAALSWSAGSLYSRRAPLPASNLTATGMQMLGGGTLLLVVSLLRGEPWSLQPAAVSARSLAALLYLIVGGSIVAFTAYTWLLKVCSPTRTSTYAYVNPLVAVFLGWFVAGEPLSGRILLAAAIILVSVALVTTRKLQPQQAVTAAATPTGGSARAA